MTTQRDLALAINALDEEGWVFVKPREVPIGWKRNDVDYGPTASPNELADAILEKLA